MFQWHQKSLCLLEVKYIPGDNGPLTEVEKANYIKLAHEKFQTTKIDIVFIEVDKLLKYKFGKIQRVISDVVSNKINMLI